MDWTTPLKAQQTDFIQRLKSAKLLRCDEKGQHSELTVISGQRLDQLRDFCWDMVKKYKPTDQKNYFINNMKGKLGQEVVKSRLADFVTEVDYEKRVGGDGKVDFTLSSDSSIGIQVKARNGNFDKIQWSISQEEIEKNAVLVCILIQEEVSEAQAKYNLILAGFLPTNMITSTDAIGIDKLLYSGGLRSYLESVAYSKAEEYMRLGNEYYAMAGLWEAEVYYNQALLINPNYAEAYLNRGIVRDALEDEQGAIEDYSQAIKINPNNTDAYEERGFSRYKLGDKQGAIEDYSQAIKINPQSADGYFHSGEYRDELGDMQGAIEYYTQAIKMNPNYAYAYEKRGVARSALGDKQGAIKDFRIAANMYKKEGKKTAYQEAMEEIRKINK
jgi:tetratricopeptide (TPR) repeat protein